MFQKGEYIVYGQHGICLVEDITHLNMSEADEKKLYYVLVPVGTRGSRIYYPADRENRNARQRRKHYAFWKNFLQLRRYRLESKNCGKIPIRKLFIPATRKYGHHF